MLYTSRITILFVIARRAVTIHSTIKVFEKGDRKLKLQGSGS